MTNTILIDCDGVLADFTSHLLAAVGSKHIIDDIKTWDVFSYLTVAQNDRASAIVATNEFWSSQPVLEGARDGVAALRAANDRVVVVTSPWVPRTRERRAALNWSGARREWLSDNFEIYNKDLVIARDKSLLRGSCLIDDRLENVVEWAQANPDCPAYLFDQPYNRLDADGNTLALPGNVLRLHGWDDVIRYCA